DYVWLVNFRLGRNQRKGFIIQHVERYFVVYDCDELSFLVGSESCPVCETEGPPAELCAYWELWPVVDGIVYSARVPPKGRRPKPPEYDDSFSFYGGVDGTFGFSLCVGRLYWAECAPWWLGDCAPPGGWFAWTPGGAAPSGRLLSRCDIPWWTWFGFGR